MLYTSLLFFAFFFFLLTIQQLEGNASPARLPFFLHLPTSPPSSTSRLLAYIVYICRVRACQSVEHMYEENVSMHVCVADDQDAKAHILSTYVLHTWFMLGSHSLQKNICYSSQKNMSHLNTLHIHTYMQEKWQVTFFFLTFFSMFFPSSPIFLTSPSLFSSPPSALLLSNHALLSPFFRLSH